MSLVRASIVILMLLQTLPSFGFQCYVLAGNRQSKTVDHNGALLPFSPLLSRPHSRIAGKDCIIVPDWTFLAQQLSLEVKKAPKRAQERILVLQAAHGGPSGTATLNCSVQSTQVIEEGIKKISGLFPRSLFILESCYSGDQLWNLFNDDKLENACMIMGSQPGRLAIVTHNAILAALETAKQGESAEDLFRRSDADVISSAPWHESGLLNYKIDSDFSKGKDALLSVAKYGAYSKSSIQRKSALLVGSVEYTEIFAQTLLVAQGGKIEGLAQLPGISRPSLLTKANFVASRRTSERGVFSREDLEKMDSELKQVREKIETNVEELNSTKATAELFLRGLDPIKDNLKIWQYNNNIENSVASLKTLGETLSCIRELSATVESAKLKAGNQIDVKALLNDLTLLVGLPQCEVIRSSPTTDNSSGTLSRALTSIIRGGTKDEVFARFQKMEVDGPLIDELEQLGKLKILESLIGRNFFSAELSAGAAMPAPGVLSPSAALSGFVRGALEFPNNFPQPRDQKHREACRNFKLGTDE